jgi:uncharacterized protein (DUF952 family)
MTYILHIIPRGVWEQAQRDGTYRGDTLDAEGFIHFSRPNQVVTVANARYKGHTGLQLLVVDPSRLTAELKYELPFEHSASDGSIAAQTAGQTFPHLYGALNLDAVVDVLDFEPNDDGLFSQPAIPD